MENERNLKTDFLVIGSGLAGMAFALKVSTFAKVIVLSKGRLQATNTSHAQGGVASVMDPKDSFQSHIDDTLTAGANLCKEEVVRNYIEQGPDRIQDLIRWGVRFDRKSAESITESTIKSITENINESTNKGTLTWDLTREGGHHQRRVMHFEDHTGAEIQRALMEECQKNPNIQLLENHFAIDLIVNKQVDSMDMAPTSCVGAYVLQKDFGGQVLSILAKSTILATGGAGKIYLYTSNWSGATGDGLAMAHRAGARLANLEFMQFHPTCLYHPDSRNFLISESLRGEGGELINAKGEPFMKKYHEMGSLAPRDIVARSIDAEMKKSAAPCVFLDMRHHTREYLSHRFPVIYQKCMELSIDMATTPIPVVPAAHYLCGGVLTDIHGQTDLPNLWALGETACTGLHGANRLASNSLLECLTMAHNCSERLRLAFPSLDWYQTAPRPWVHPEESDDDEMVVITHMWEEIRRLMWNYVGIVRSNKRLERASHRLQNILLEVKEYYSNFKIHSDILELRNIAIVAELSVQCALRRKESRGIHFSLDYPQFAQKGEDTIVR